MPMPPRRGGRASKNRVVGSGAQRPASASSISLWMKSSKDCICWPKSNCPREAHESSVPGGGCSSSMEGCAYAMLPRCINSGRVRGSLCSQSGASEGVFREFTEDHREERWAASHALSTRTSGGSGGRCLRMFVFYDENIQHGFLFTIRSTVIVEDRDSTPFDGVGESSRCAPCTLPCSISFVNPRMVPSSTFSALLLITRWCWMNRPSSKRLSMSPDFHASNLRLKQFAWSFALDFKCGFCKRSSGIVIAASSANCSRTERSVQA